MNSPNRQGRKAKSQSVQKMQSAVMEPLEGKMMLTIPPGLEDVVGYGLAGPAAQERMTYWDDGQWRPFTIEHLTGSRVLITATLPDGSKLHFDLKPLLPGQAQEQDAEPVLTAEEEDVTDTPAAPFNTRFTIVLDEEETISSDDDPAAFERRIVDGEEWVEVDLELGTAGEHEAELTLADAQGVSGSVSLAFDAEEVGSGGMMMEEETGCLVVEYGAELSIYTGVTACVGASDINVGEESAWTAFIDWGDGSTSYYGIPDDPEDPYSLGLSGEADTCGWLFYGSHQYWEAPACGVATLTVTEDDDTVASVQFQIEVSDDPSAQQRDGWDFHIADSAGQNYRPYIIYALTADTATCSFSCYSSGTDMAAASAFAGNEYYSASARATTLLGMLPQSATFVVGYSCSFKFVVEWWTWDVNHQPCEVNKTIEFMVVRGSILLPKSSAASAVQQAIGTALYNFSIAVVPSTPLTDLRDIVNEVTSNGWNWIAKPY